MKSLSRFGGSIILLILFSTFGLAQASPAKPDQAEAAKNWSLFFEYHKNGDFLTAAPYGWRVIQLDPVKFKTIYRKLAECYYNFSQKADSAARKAFVDTMLVIYDLGIQNLPDRAAEHWLLRGYALANYAEGREADAITSYEKAIALDSKTDFIYIDQLGVLYAENVGLNPSYRTKAIDLYRKEREKDPNNPVPVQRLKSLISDPHELVKLAESDLKNDPENPEKIYAAAMANFEAEEHVAAEQYLLRLTKKFPANANYWQRLGETRQHAGKFRQAIDSYEQALKLNAALRDNYLNISACYRSMKNYGAARSTVLKAAQKEKGWGRPFFELAEVYKAAVENCIRDTKGGDWGKMEIDDKLLYKLAQESYARARTVEPALANEAIQAIQGLSTYIPTKEDYFFNRSRIVNGKITIQGQCYSWVNEEVAVPSL